uniref:EOG090X0GPG n=1 Tax=Eubosmina coregoni TaxID=186181 RepID=A0A4Y7LS47_9CRUS|nr:EOG090X0GPG [Eubosmina coregoni]SVE70143.1 EOG090X0GPG [Eubosmina coregoni]
MALAERSKLLLRLRQAGPDTGKGFLCTTGREKDAVREAYNILNSYADILYKSSDSSDDKAKGGVETKADELEIEDELSKEVAEMKKEYAAPIAERRFQNVLSNVKCCIYIRTTLENPTELVNFIFDDIKKNKQQNAKFLLRMYPIETTCKANVEEILKVAEKLIEEKMANFKTFSLIVNIRNNPLKSLEVIEPLANLVSKKFPETKVDLSNPEASYLVPIFSKICLLDALHNSAHTKKFRLPICPCPETPDTHYVVC